MSDSNGSEADALNATKEELVPWDGFTGSKWPGVLMILFTVPAIFCYSICITVVWMDKDMSRTASYRIMIHLGLADIVQLVLNGLIAGVMSLLQETGPFLFNKINGAFLDAHWALFIVLANLLAWNRLIQVCHAPLARRIFRKRPTTALIAICWLWAAVWAVACLWPDCDFVYSPPSHVFYYTDTGPSQFVAYFQMVHDSLFAASMGASYTVIFVRLVQQAKAISNKQLNTDKKEKQVLLQSAWICSTTVLVIASFFAFPLWFSGPHIGYVSNLLWLICAGSNGFIYLIFNKTIRRRSYALITRNRVELETKVKSKWAQSSFNLPTVSAHDARQINIHVARMPAVD